MQPEVDAPKKKGSKKPSVCFILSCAVPAVANIGSFCTTDNHWADDVTSKALVKDIVVKALVKAQDQPAPRSQRVELQAIQRASLRPHRRRVVRLA